MIETPKKREFKTEAEHNLTLTPDQKQLIKIVSYAVACSKDAQKANAGDLSDTTATQRASNSSYSTPQTVQLNAPLIRFLIIFRSS